MIKIVCEDCSFVNKVEFKKSLMGKRILFNCKNPKCSQQIKYKFPNKLESFQDDFQTKITGYNHKTTYKGALKWKDKHLDKDVTFEIFDGVNIVGRASSSKNPDIAIPTHDRSMSRMHCVIIKVKNHDQVNYLLKEYGNKNPLKLNSKILDPGTEIYLENGDVISLGLTELSFVFV